MMSRITRLQSHPRTERFLGLWDVIRTIAMACLRAFPVQLLIRQVKSQKILILIWLILLGLISGSLGSDYGGAFLFLEPEYLGNENFWSLFIVGSTLGAFLFAYHISSYIHVGYRYHFLAFHKNPFAVFVLNNFLLPGTFLFIYFYRFISYHTALEGGFTMEVFGKVAGLFLGMALLFLLGTSYFFARRGLFQRVGSKLQDEIAKKQPKRNRRMLLEKARESIRDPDKVAWYLSFPFKPTRIRKESESIRKVISRLKQNHGKLLLYQIGFLGFIALLGLLEDNPYFQFPAGASLLLFSALLLLVLGALTYWFRRSWMLSIGAVFLLVWANGNLGMFKGKNQAIGIDYSRTPVRYDRQTLEDITSDSTYRSDKEEGFLALDSWKANFEKTYSEKPRAVFVTASGGGLRSALWTYRTMQVLDSLSQGRLGDELRLMAGASGGMYGLSYYREIDLQRRLGKEVSPQDDIYARNISKDLLNRLFFTSITDLILPVRTEKIGSNRHYRDRGASFDHQLMQNLPELNNRRLGDYSDYEARGLTPMVVYTPTIINQGRKLYISASPVSYLSRPSSITEHYTSKFDGIEFRRLFAGHDPDSLLIASALRMNSTIPYIMPIVELPSEPKMEIMDAGAIDNYGTQTVIKYLFEFREWFDKNTSGILIVQIRDNDRVDPISKAGGGYISDLLRPLGGGYNSMIEAKDMSNDFLMEFIHEWYEGPVEVVSLVYPRDSGGAPVSLSWHLTHREKKNIERGLETEKNRHAFSYFETMYSGPRYLADKGASDPDILPTRATDGAPE